MKRLYVIVLSILMLFMWYTFAADFDITVTPASQYAISGTVVWFDISVTSNTGIDAYIQQNYPSWLIYLNSDVVPYNNPALSLWLENNPRWKIQAWQTLSIHVDTLVQAYAFFTQDIVSDITDDSASTIYTSYTVLLEPISDLIVSKVLTWNSPQFSGDSVMFEIKIKNVWSKIATWVSLVDIWPDNFFDFSDQWLVDGTSVIPTIYNWNANNYLFPIPDLLPDAICTVNIDGTMDSQLLALQEFRNDAFVFADSIEYSTNNNSTFVTWNVLGYADLSVYIWQVSPDPIFSWDLVWYIIKYQNVGYDEATGVLLESVLSSGMDFDSSSPMYDSQISWWQYIWNLNTLAVWQSGFIYMTWVFLWGNLLSNDIHIVTSSVDDNWRNNRASSTWEMQHVSDMSLQLYATNLTDLSRNFDTGTQIFAISGDIVKAQIVIQNSGNESEMWNVSISNISNFVDYNWQTSWTGVLSAWSTHTIFFTWSIGPKNFVGFSPSANLIYDNVLRTDDVEIDEPLECGDWLLTQSELCDTNGQIWSLLSWQHCDNIDGICTVITDDVINTVCMDYTTSIWTGKQCMTVSIPYGDDEDARCNGLFSPYRVVIVWDDNEWSMQYTCNTVSGIVADEIRINCGNWHEWIWYATSSFTYDCNYTYDENGTIQDNIYDVQCYVDEDTNESCIEAMRVDQWFYGVCGDWIIDDGEECDLWWDEDEEITIVDYLDSNRQYNAWDYWNSRYNCRNCRIRQDNVYAYQTPQCLDTNTTISVMDNELMPFWRRLWNRDNLKLREDYDCSSISDNETRTIIDKDTMKCTFVVYNWNNYRQVNDDALNRFTVDCFHDDNSIVFDYFTDNYHVDFDKVSGKYVANVSTLFDRNVDSYGEYKLVLDKVDYDYCDPTTKSWESGRTYQWVCEVNFAFTRPYMMQISTFGVDPVATDGSDFLKDFYDMYGNPLINSADINDTLDVDARNYGFDSSTSQQMSSFKSRYLPLSIVVNNNFEVRDGKTIWDLFDNAHVRKVPNKSIFFVNGSGNLVLKQLTDYFPKTPYTIYVEWMDVTVVGSVKTNGMIITDNKIYFEDSPDYDYCEKWGQIVQWIFVAKWWFGSLSRLRNQIDQKRCQWWNLKIKWVLIGDWIDNLMSNRRSNLNTWFQVNGDDETLVARERKDEIFNGAALLIEYNPELWSSLPPWAESFTESLDIYKN